MIIVLKDTATEKQMRAIVSRIEKLGLKVHHSLGLARIVLGVTGIPLDIRSGMIAVFAGVDSVRRIASPDGSRTIRDAIETYLLGLPPHEA